MKELEDVIRTLPASNELSRLIGRVFRLYPDEYAYNMTAAWRLVDALREQHNGIMGIYVYAGHDGDNACTFKDSNGAVLAQLSAASPALAVCRTALLWLIAS